ncbi:MAG: hypothetical protein DMG13_16765 [Acidobacteria bacterium]|nr:MAG: hypothetical protein DMG13_16765 [Acidobacteriota bacterium]
MKLDGKKVLMVIPYTQFRDEELFEPKKILEDEGATVVIASTAARACRGMRGGSVEASIAIADAKAEDYAALVIRISSGTIKSFRNSQRPCRRPARSSPPSACRRSYSPKPSCSPAWTPLSTSFRKPSRS